MKKVLIGCGIVLIVLVAVIGSVGYWAYNNFKEMSAEVQVAQTQLESVNHDFPFQAPGDGKLDEAKFTAWLKVRGKLQELEKDFMGRLQQGGFKAINEMAHLMPDMMKKSAQALREAKMSPAEYGWITSQAMGSLKSRAAEKDPKTAELAKLIDEPAPMPQGNRPNNIRMQERNRPNYAPLAVEDAQPVLELIKKHDADFRKVAHFTMIDAMITNQVRSERAPRNANRATTASAVHTPTAQNNTTTSR